MVAVLSKREARHSSESAEHYTPKAVIALARSVMGTIDLDPASSAKANTIVEATRFYTEKDNGLAQAWSGRVWLNPPGGCLDRDDRPAKHGRSAAKRWWQKLEQEYRTGRVTEAIFLGFNLDVLQNTQLPIETAYPVLDYPICIPRQRIKFLEPDTLQEQKQPTHANVLVYLPLRDGAVFRIDRFCTYFSILGKCKR